MTAILGVRLTQALRRGEEINLRKGEITRSLQQDYKEAPNSFPFICTQAKPPQGFFRDVRRLGCGC
jgi:hypothetical protein